MRARTNPAAWHLLHTIDLVEDTISRAPVMAVRMSRDGHGCQDFLNAFDAALVDIGHHYNVPLDAPHITRRRAANRKRNKAARAARRATRRAAA